MLQAQFLLTAATMFPKHDIVAVAFHGSNQHKMKKAIDPFCCIAMLSQSICFYQTKN